MPLPTWAMPACLSWLPGVHGMRTCRRHLAHALKKQCLRSQLNGDKQSSKAGSAHEMPSKASSKAGPGRKPRSKQVVMRRIMAT